MPKINVYDQQVTANLTGNIAPAPNVSVTNPISQSAGALGQSISQVGGEMFQNDIQLAAFQKQQQEDASRLNAAKVSSQSQLQWAQKFQEMQRTATGTASGFTTNFLKEYDDYAKQTLSEYQDPVSQKFLQSEFEQMRRSFGLQGLHFENTMFTNAKVQDANSMVEANAAILSQDPTQYSALRAKTIAGIQASGLPEIEQQKLIEQAKKTYTYSTMNNLLMNDPERGFNMLRPSVGKLPEGSVPSQVVELAKQSGVDPLYTLATAGVESGVKLSPNQNDKSSAKGMFQFVNKTGAQYGINGDSSLNDQVAAFGKFTQDNRNMLIGNLGREPSNQELYLAHHFGANGATKLLQADKNLPVSEVVGESVIKANPYLKDKTVGEAININFQKYNDKAKQFVDKEQLAVNAHPVIADLNPEQRVQYANRFQNEIDTRAQVQAVNLTQTMNDQIAMASTGNTNFQQLTQQQFYAMYPKDQAKAEAVFRQYTGAIQLGRDINTINNMTPEQENALVQSYSPKQEIGFAGDLKRQQELVAAIQHKRKALQEDRVDWVMRNSSTVQAAFNKIGTIGNPELQSQARDQAFATLIAEQKRLGISFPELISKSQEDQAIQTLVNTQGMDRAKALQQMSQQYGRYWPQVAGQLQQNKALPEGMTAIMSAPTPAAMQAASIASSIDIKQLRDSISNHKDVDDEVKTNLKSFYASIPSEQMSSKTIGDMTDTITKVAYNNARQGMKPRIAAQTAVDMFVGKDKYNYLENSNSNFTIRIPKKYNQEIISENLENNINALDINTVDTSGAKLLRNAWNMEDNANGYLNQIKSTAFWQTNGDETGARLFFKGHNNIIYPVKGKDGMQITKSFQDLSITANNPDMENKASATYKQATTQTPLWMK